MQSRSVAGIRLACSNMRPSPFRVSWRLALPHLIYPLPSPYPDSRAGRQEARDGNSGGTETTKPFHGTTKPAEKRGSTAAASRPESGR
jgi:hypothetical protein